jgi:hypothetical protein
VPPSSSTAETAFSSTMRRADSPSSRGPSPPWASPWA